MEGGWSWGGIEVGWVVGVLVEGGGGMGEPEQVEGGRCWRGVAVEEKLRRGQGR